MKLEQAYLVGEHRYSFRSGEGALITGVLIIQPDNCTSARLCFELLYNDGVIDYIPVSEYENGRYVVSTKGEYNNRVESDA